MGNILDLEAKHIALLVAVDQAELDLPDQRRCHLVPLGDIDEILPRYARCLGANRRGNGGHRAFGIKQQRRLAEDFIGANPVQPEAFGGKQLNRTFHDQIGLMRRFTGAVDHLVGVPDDKIVTFQQD
tara:strand:+ start:1113 stop:1493 length:381 start_codon:yes stop_codon:yes gene_type:complete